MAEPVRVRRLTETGKRKLQRIVRRGGTSTLRFRRALTLPASAGGNTVPVIARFVQVGEDTVRDVIHRFNEIGLACLGPSVGGRPSSPRLLSGDDEDFVVATATTRPTELGQPFTCWSTRELAACLRKVHGRIIRIGREALRRLLARRGITFQRTKPWKESPDPERDAKPDRIEEVLERFPDRGFAFDEFGPLGIRPTAAPTYVSWANPIEARFGPRRQFTVANSHPRNHTAQARTLHASLRRRNKNARHPDVLAAQRRERARIRGEKGIRWGGRARCLAAWRDDYRHGPVSQHEPQGAPHGPSGRRRRRGRDAAGARPPYRRGLDGAGGAARMDLPAHSSAHRP
ncbi:helix-turn-helix domain-containing protein [Streptomyces sp. NPDC055186]